MCLPKAAHCDGHPVPEPEETQVAGFPLALQVTSVVVRRQEPIATAAPLSRPFQAGEGCRGVGSCKRAACWARAREKGPVVARLTPPQSWRACARSSPADRGLLFQGSARGQAPAPAGGIKGCLAGLPQTPGLFDAAGGRRAACPHGARPRAHVLRALPSPPPDRWLKASQFWKPVLRGNLDAQEWKVLMIAYLSPESPAKRKTWFTTGVRNTRHASQFKRGKVFASPEMGLFPSCLN